MIIIKNKYLIFSIIICIIFFIIFGYSTSKINRQENEINIYNTQNNENNLKINNQKNGNDNFLKSNEGNDAWENGLNGTKYYNKETGLFLLYGENSKRSLIQLKVPKGFFMSYASEDGTAYTLCDDNYNIISVYGTISSITQQYYMEGKKPSYYDKYKKEYIECEDYKCEKIEFPIAHYNSYLVSESYTYMNETKINYYYLWIPYHIDNKIQYIQFTISDSLINNATEEELKEIFHDILVF